MVIGPFSLLVIATLALLLFGASRLGDVGRGLGQGVRAFKKGMQRQDEDEAPRAPKVRQLESEPDDEPDDDEGVPMRRRIAAKKPSAKKLAEKNDSEDEDERS
jgi:sec-independent protein translocase protein TatA